MSAGSGAGAGTRGDEGGDGWGPSGTGGVVGVPGVEGSTTCVPAMAGGGSTCRAQPEEITIRSASDPASSSLLLLAGWAPVGVRRIARRVLRRAPGCAGP